MQTIELKVYELDERGKPIDQAPVLLKEFVCVDLDDGRHQAKRVILEKGFILRSLSFVSLEKKSPTKQQTALVAYVAKLPPTTSGIPGWRYKAPPR
jgi:hypothetical protein